MNRKVPMLSCEGVSRIYGDNYALIEVSTSLHAGRVKALLGSNGAGKSTLLGLCSSRMTPSEGRILFKQQALARVENEFRRTLGVISHQVMLYEELSGFENLAFFAAINGAAQADDVLLEALAAVGLTWAKDRRVSEYSRGMQQRLTLARALIHNPTLLLLDEPFTGLDQAGIRLTMERLEDMKSRGAAILVSSHDLAVLDSIADEALILERGRVVYDGPVEGTLSSLYRKTIEGGAR